MCQSLFFNKVAGCHFVKKEAQAQLLGCEFCEIFKNTCLQRTPPVVASVKGKRVVELLEKKYHETNVTELFRI